MFAYQLTVDNDNVDPDSGVVQRWSKNTGRSERWNRMFWMRGTIPDGEAVKEDLQSVVDADLPRNHVGGSTVHVEADLVTRTLLGYTRPWRRRTFMINAQPAGLMVLIRLHLWPERLAGVWPPLGSCLDWLASRQSAEEERDEG